jgi:Holliday junction resolvasome RuvABC DNA-binding subunit
MAQTGPIFFLSGRVPNEWVREGAYLPDAQIPLLTEEGVAYLLDVYSADLRLRLESGQPTSVFIAQILREDAEILFAFQTAQERALFLEVKDVKDIGPKTAAAVVGAMGVRGLMDLTVGRDWTGPKVPGLGSKTLDSLKFGLGKKKEKFIKLLSSQAVSSDSPKMSSAEIRNDSFSIPRSIRLGLEGLGMPGSAALKLYADCLNDIPDFANLEDVEKLQTMLRRWGQFRMRGAPEV